MNKFIKITKIANTTMKMMLLMSALVLLLLVVHCGGGDIGGSGIIDPEIPPDPGPSHLISGVITWPSGFGKVPVFDVSHEGTRDVGGFSIGSQALYSCSNVTCDCAGNCNYQISEYDGTYAVSVYIASAYGDYVSTPISHTVVVSGSDIAGWDFQINPAP